jgi:hypothetical protein
MVSKLGRIFFLLSHCTIMHNTHYSTFDYCTTSQISLSLKEKMPFFSYHLEAVEHSFGSLFSKNVYKLSTKTVESWKSGPNFLERPPFLDEYVVLKECYLVGIECQIQDIITIRPEKPTLNCFGNPGNVGMFTTKVYKFVNASTSLQICSTNVYNCLQRIYMITKPIQDLIIYDKVFFTTIFWRVSNILGQGIIE